MATYTIREVVIYQVEAASAQEAYDTLVESDNHDQYFIEVPERDIVDGPDGWDDEEYDAY